MKSLSLFSILLLCILNFCLARKTCNCLINIYVTPFFDCCKEYSENNESGKCKNIH